jgi:hypothetical protein
VVLRLHEVRSGPCRKVTSQSMTRICCRQQVVFAMQTPRMSHSVPVAADNRFGPNLGVSPTSIQRARRPTEGCNRPHTTRDHAVRRGPTHSTTVVVLAVGALVLRRRSTPRSHGFPASQRRMPLTGAWGRFKIPTVRHLVTTIPPSLFLGMRAGFRQCGSCDSAPEPAPVGNGQYAQGRTVSHRSRTMTP